MIPPQQKARPQSTNTNPTRKFDQAIDLTGLRCPFTFVRTKLALEKMSPGECLCVVVDDPTAATNLPRSAKEWGQLVECVESIARPNQTVWQITIRRCLSNLADT